MTVEALRGRRPEVLADLLDAHGRELQGVAFLILRDRAAAEDVVVETLLTAFDRGDTLRDPDALRPWLLRIATNRALAVRRSEARVVQLHVVPDRVAPTPRRGRCASRSWPASTACRHGCARRWCCATTPTCRSRASPRRSAPARTP